MLGILRLGQWLISLWVGILPASCPYLDSWLSKGKWSSKGSDHNVQSNQSSCEAIAENLVKQFQTLFDGNICIMEGKKFCKYLVDNVMSFWVRTILFAYKDKLKTELDVLLEQRIIAPVTQVTEWCAPIVLAPKKGRQNSDVHKLVPLKQVCTTHCWAGIYICV